MPVPFRASELFFPAVSTAPRHLLFIFLDGVGLGSPSSHNPLAVPSDRRPALGRLAGGHPWTGEAPHRAEVDHVFHPIDATLGLDGLPQSGTGQATLFTGVNCAEVVGRHFGPFPHSATHPILAKDNVFARIQRRCGPATTAFANAYPPRFFEHVRRRNRWTVTTRCCHEAQVPIRGLNDVLNGQALTADLTGAGWEPLGHSLPRLSPAEAGQQLVQISRAHRFTLFEYFLTDKAGHGRLDATPATILDTVDYFLQGTLDALDPSETLLLITSDHGNIEASNQKTHTRNPVPLIAYGRGAHHFAEVAGLTGVTPAIVQTLPEELL